MSLRLYTILLTLSYVFTLLFFSVLMTTMICIMESNSKFWILYLIQIIRHFFESYNLFCLAIFFILFNVTTFYFKKIRSLTFIILVSAILGIVLNDYELRVLFVYKSQPITQNFYIYLISYTITIILWCTMLKKLWKSV